MMTHRPKKRTRAPGGGRKPGPRMPCGWGCGAQLTAVEIREHFTSCPCRPSPRENGRPNSTKRT